MVDVSCDVVCWDPLGEQHPAFTAVLQDQNLRALTAACLGEKYSETEHSLAMYSCSGGRGQAWHQD